MATSVIQIEQLMKILQVERESDPTDRGVNTALELVRDFDRAILEATCLSRSFQIWERVRIIEDLVSQLRDRAAEATDRMMARTPPAAGWNDPFLDARD